MYVCLSELSELEYVLYITLLFYGLEGIPPSLCLCNVYMLCLYIAVYCAVLVLCSTVYSTLLL